MASLGQHFTPEFLGRLDKIITFEPLQPQVMEQIAKKYLDQLTARAAQTGLQLMVAPELAAVLCAGCKGREGARQLRRTVQSRVEGPLAEYLLRCSRRPGKVKVMEENGEICFRSPNSRTDVQK